MYSVDLKNIVPKGGLTCLFAKATSDESKLLHRRLGPLNFKTMNKLVKGNLVRGLPSKLFENDQTCVACQKGKQHRTSCKSKTENSISLLLHLLHMDLFGPTFVSLMKKMYCLVVTDDYSRFTWVFFLATKDETNGNLKCFIIGIENLLDHKVKAEAVNTACYVKNRVLVVKPHNKTSYELFHGRTPTLSFMRPFGCPVTILNIIDHLGKFDGKADEGFFVGYSLNSKAFRVFNSRTRIVEENLHIMFSENTPNTVGSGPDWLFDIDALTRTMNYEPIVADYILLPLWTADPPFSHDLKSSQDDESKPSNDDRKKVDEDPRKDSECKDQEKEDNVNSTNNVNTVSSTVNTADTNEVNVVGLKTSIELPLDPNRHELEDYSIFNFSRGDEDDDAEADMNNLDTTIQVSPIPTTRIHKDHPLDQDPSWIEAMQEELLQFKKDKNVNIVRPKAVVNAARPKAVVNAVKGNNVNVVKASACWVWKPKNNVVDHVSNQFQCNQYPKKFDFYVIATRKIQSVMALVPKKKIIFLLIWQGNPQMDLQDQGVIDSGCSRHMTGNMSYLTGTMNESDGGYVSFWRKILMEENHWKRFTFKTLLKYSTCVALSKGKQIELLVKFQYSKGSIRPTFAYVSGFFFLATKDETSGILKSFITRVENLIDQRVKDHLGKFNGKADEGLFVGYSINSKSFRVLNSRTRIFKENLQVQFSENTPNIVGSGPNWNFDIDALTKSMNYKPVVAGNQSNGNACTKAYDDAGKARMETIPGKDYILLLLWTADPPFSQTLKSSPNAGFKPSRDDEKKVTEKPGKEGDDPSKEDKRDDQEKDASVNSTNNVNDASTNEVNVVGRKASIELLDDLNMPALEDIVYSDDDEDVGAEADMNNLDAFMPVIPIPTTRVHKDHPVEQIIRDLNSAPQTRRMTKNLEEHGLFSSVQQRTNHKDFQNCLFSYFLSQVEPKKVWTLVDLPNGKRPIGTKWVFRNKKDERGIMIKNKARLVAQGYTQEERIGYDEVFAPVAIIEAIRLFLAYASFKDFMVYQMDVKSAFLYGLQVKQKEDGIFISQDKYVTEILKKFGFTDVKTASTPMETQKLLLWHEDGKDSGDTMSNPKLGLWYPKDSPFDLVAYTDSDYAGASLDRKSTTGAVDIEIVAFRHLRDAFSVVFGLSLTQAYTDSDYAGASLDRKSTTGGCQFLRSRLISWQCKKQTVVANSTTEAEYGAATSCCGQVLWIQNQLLDYGYNFLHTKIFIDNKSTICIIKNPVFHSTTKHIEIRHHFIRDCSEKKLI
ncbi:putative ribonuclease H-like domain-containing protein [Tanacetum coccineum]|uniref:Ribonuclease H-like domain-containing protein n=1 Tax=Tanacetum coccineum TaxID=301880 RepID=A0ABQ5HFP0_9ASTR